MNAGDDVRLRPADGPLDHTVRLPGSKSLSNRALLIAALAGGTSELSHLLFADDTRHMITALRTLGVPLRIDEDICRADVSGRSGHWPGGEAEIFCGNAGTVMRFLTAACCLGHGVYRLDGIPRMRERPIGDLVDTLRDLGATIGYEDREGCCPLTIRANGLRGGRTGFRGTPSSQFVSALLIAAPLASSDVLIEIAGPLPSKPYVGMTLKVMEAFGVSVVEEDFRRFIVPGGQSYTSTDYAVEPDASAASYFFAAAALAGGRITVEGLGRESCQGDIRIVGVLEQMGCSVELEARRTTVHGPEDGLLRGVDVDLGDMPDVAQTLAVLAAFAEGPTRIRNVANLRVKETDRLAALSAELGRMGVRTEMHADGLSIFPEGLPKAAAIDTYDDHRMAMSFSLAGLKLGGMVIRGAGCVSKTFPDFFEAWSKL